jgi:hypothetical protein
VSIHITDKVFQLQRYGGREFQCIVVVPETVTVEAVQAAWANAVRYTAKGLDLPDHDAAVQRLQERHPSWTLILSSCVTIGVDLSKANNDVAEKQ